MHFPVSPLCSLFPGITRNILPWRDRRTTHSRAQPGQVFRTREAHNRRQIFRENGKEVRMKKNEDLGEWSIQWNWQNLWKTLVFSKAQPYITVAKK